MKKILLTTVFMVASFSAQAQEAVQANSKVYSYADITNPFYIPENSILTDTTLTYSKEKLNPSVDAPNGNYLKNANSTKISEMVTYGITDTWAVYGGIGYDWTKKGSSLNILDLTVGTKVNTIEEEWRVQIGADVTWTDYAKWKNTENPNKKTTNLYLMAGTETSDKIFSYAKGSYKNVEYGDTDQYDEYSVMAAMHILASNTTTADVGLDYTWDTIPGIRSKDLTFFVGGNLNIYQNMTIGLTADYVIASSNNIKTAYADDNQGSYTLGFNIKYEF